MRDKERIGQSKKFEDVELQELLDENPSGQTFLKLSIALNVTPLTISKHLHAIRKIHKEKRWLSHEMSENAILNHLSIASSLFARQRKKSFLWRIVTGDEKWIYLDNPKRRKLGVNSSQLQRQRRIFADLRPCSAFDVHPTDWDIV